MTYIYTHIDINFELGLYHNYMNILERFEVASIIEQMVKNRLVVRIC